MVWKERLRSLPKASVAFGVVNGHFSATGLSATVLFTDP
jgi:hypothetical protein